VVGLTIGGVGLAVLVVGVITAVMTRSATENAAPACGPSGCRGANASLLDSARGLALASDITLIAGPVAMVTGAHEALLKTCPYHYPT
jgi:hypothetical protein